jgi:hypothetical protein
MLTGLEILLARMKTNPEEFLLEGRTPHDGEVFGGKWGDLIDYAWRIGTEDERGAIQEAREEFLHDDFNERVFKRLAGEEKQGEKEETMKVRMGARYSISQSDPRGLYGGVGFSGGGILSANTQTAGSQTVEEYEQQQKQRQLYAQIQQEAMKEEMAQRQYEMAQRQYDAMRQSGVPFGGTGVGKRGFFKKFGW